MSDPTWADLESAGVDRRRDFGLAIGWGLVVLIGGAALIVLTVFVLRDETRNSVYREAQNDARVIGPTNGRLDDGRIVGAATFYDEDGRICTIYGPPGERTEPLYCVPDTTEQVDAVNWSVDPVAGIDLTVALVDGESPTVEFEFDGPTPGHALSWFPIPKPGLVAVYVGPPWTSLDVQAG